VIRTGLVSGMGKTKMRRVSAEEFREWCDDHSVNGQPFPAPDLIMLKEMEDEGMIFEIGDIEGYEYPHINSNHWMKRDGDWVENLKEAIKDKNAPDKIWPRRETPIDKTGN
jgi:hypothetical protein